MIKTLKIIFNLISINFFIYLGCWFVLENPRFWEYDIFIGSAKRFMFLFAEIILLFIAWLISQPNTYDELNNN